MGGCAPLDRDETVSPVGPPVAQRAVQERSVRTVPKHFPALDGLRGFALLYVFLAHYGGGKHGSYRVVRAIGFVCDAGWTGVTLFFLLSGFLITGLLWDAKGERHWARNFYLRRALRIWPLYYGTLLALFLWPLFDPRYDFHSVGSAVLIHAAYLQNVPVYNWKWKQVPLPFWLEHYWTLAVEEQFYLLWPVLLWCAKTRRQALILCLSTVVFSVLFSVYNLTLPNPPGMWRSLPVHGGELGLGAGLALAFRSRYWLQVKRAAQVFGVVGIVAFVAGMASLPQRESIFRFGATDGLAAATLAYAGLLVSVLEPGPWQRLGSVRPLRWLGGISFGAYVFHLLPVTGYNELVHWMTGRQDGDFIFDLTRIAVVALITLGVAWVSFHYYERPFLKLKQRIAAHRPAAASVAS